MKIEKIEQGTWKPTDEPRKPRKLQEVLDDKNKLKPENKEFQGLGWLDQQKHTLKFSQDVAKKYGKHNR